MKNNLKKLFILKIKQLSITQHLELKTQNYLLNYFAANLDSFLDRTS